MFNFGKKFKKMLKDIPDLKVQDVSIAIAKEKNEFDEWLWYVYIINYKNEDLEGVIVASKGYGEVNGEAKKTSVLRHFIELLPAKSIAKVEPIMDDLLPLNNEFWVSFCLNNKIYDKKFVFLSESISDEFMVEIPLLNKKGIIIK
jgi:hypothetical protein